MKLSRHLINLIILSCASSKIYSMEEVKQPLKKDQQTNTLALSSSGEITPAKSLFGLPTVKQNKGGSKKTQKINLTNQFDKLTFEEPKTSKPVIVSQAAVQLPALIEKENIHPRLAALSTAIKEQLENGALSADVSKRVTQLGKIVLLCHEARAGIPRTEIAARKEIASLEKAWQLQINSLQPTEKNRVFQETGELSGYTSDGEYKADEASYGKFKTKNTLLTKITAQANGKNTELQKLITQSQDLEKSIAATKLAHMKLTKAQSELGELETVSKNVVATDVETKKKELEKLISQKQVIDKNVENLTTQYQQLTGAQKILTNLEHNDADFVTEQKNILNQKVTDTKVNLANLQTKKSSETNPTFLVELNNQITSLQKQIAQDEADMKIYSNHLERMEKRMNPVQTASWFGGWWPFGTSTKPENSAKPSDENLNKEEKQ